MKLSLLTPFLICIISCKSNQTSDVNLQKTAITVICPEDGTCDFEVLQNKNLKISKDEFGSSYQTIVDGDHIILKFIYQRDEIPNTSDSGYREEILLQLNPDQLVIDLKDLELKQVNLHFGRFCFCRGQTGIYEIINGQLSIIKTTSGNYLLNLEFKTSEAPQIITKIAEEFSLK